MGSAMGLYVRVLIAASVTLAALGQTVARSADNLSPSEEARRITDCVVTNRFFYFLMADTIGKIEKGTIEQRNSVVTGRRMVMEHAKQTFEDIAADGTRIIGEKAFNRSIQYSVDLMQSIIASPNLDERSRAYEEWTTQLNCPELRQELARTR